MLENCWKIILLRFHTTLRFLLCGEISIAIVCSSGFIAAVSKIGSSGFMAAVAEKYPQLQYVKVAPWLHQRRDLHGCSSGNGLQWLRDLYGCSSGSGLQWLRDLHSCSSGNGRQWLRDLHNRTVQQWLHGCSGGEISRAAVAERSP